VRSKRVYLTPSLPYGWLGEPAGVNRLIGARWLTAVLYPDWSESLRDAIRGFYTLFCQDLTAEQADHLLASAIP
jgi:iron complex transport system substrate-binding protein